MARSIRLRRLKEHLPPLNFITLHYGYFVCTCLVSAVIFWGASTPPRSVSFVDSLFLVVSAMTEAGLNTINLSSLNTFQQFMLFALIMLGSAIWVSAWVVLVRRRAFEKKFRETQRSQIHDLDASEREKLGGHEYRAVSLLAWLVPAYYVSWQLLGALGCAAWVATNQPDTALTNGLNPWWVGAFNAVSAFNNSGMSLLDANMIAFQRSYYLLITMGLLILAGNTCYPVFLRLIVWTMCKITSNLPGEKWQKRTTTLRFLLDHPRRCYTNLFPAEHTWWLLFTIICLNGIDWAAFEIFNIGNTLLDDAIPTNIRVIDGLFQAFAVRSGGFYVVVIPNLRIALLVLYVVMMYIAVYPVVITIRSSNVYEERSLGIYADDPKLQYASSTEIETPEPTTPPLRRAVRTAYRFFAGTGHITATPKDGNFVSQQLRAQLSSDLWVLVLALILVMIIDNQAFVDDPVNFSVFNVLFELVSGYGTVGISVGVPYDSYSFCGSWSTLSKLVLCFVMIRGRHRGLPVAIDKAVLLPGEARDETERDIARVARSLEVARPKIV